MGVKKLCGIALAGVLVMLTPAVTVYAATKDDIAKELICQCGCTLLLSNCNHIECMSRDSMLTLIDQKLAQGQTQEQIIQFFVNDYGEQVLASPPKRGFNLTAWIAPFAAILLGGVVIFFAIRKWVRRSELPPATVIAAEEEDTYRQRLEKELDRFTERGYR
ncbi:MAG: cytochrome c-type biogenesis protein CcmH [Chloroflexi bacterium]|nr:cytochrome c-type biogenesis protein CcmH [Chloroflexota bacterium]